MKLTVKMLKKKLEKMDDEDLIYIERIEDVYFEKYNWESEIVEWMPGDSTEYTLSSGTARTGKKLIIMAHI